MSQYLIIYFVMHLNQTNNKSKICLNEMTSLAGGERVK